MTDYELTGLLMQLHARRRHCISSMIKDENLHMGQLPILINIIKLSGSTQKEIAKRLDVTPASIATSCKRLELAGLLERRVDERNRRCNMLYATEKGKQVAERCKRMFEAVDQRMYAGLDEAERASLAGVLHKIIDAIEDTGAGYCCACPEEGKK